MKQTVDRLQKIESQMEAIGENIRREGQVYRAELEERQLLGLHGEDAIKHYNEWMKKYGKSFKVETVDDFHMLQYNFRNANGEDIKI